uniref:tRNA carboxymethyluridine synthase n=1 Tax=uncultured Chloroflexota bacterium TaxID=166587 RepID=H5SER9_9CHLR|nr:histone acetyltransferase [uncultured Chloroflexota bacterium]
MADYTIEILERQRLWRERKAWNAEKWEAARQALRDIQQGEEVLSALRAHPLPDGSLLGKSALVFAYREMVRLGELREDAELLERIRMKPVRTLSGVTTVTVLTKPYPCPGKCIFCPTDVRMPKSYLPDEPGAMRGLEHGFDPYAQVRARLEALQMTGHPTDKVELLILGGTWSAYRRDYQAWFIRRCFEALNREGPPDEPDPTEGRPPQPIDLEALRSVQQKNESAPHRNVGLVIETRPDEITPAEIRWLRTLGVTKVQLGAQSLDDRILALNQRGHDAATTRRAVSLLRHAGFKIVLHWMPNLLGATPESDRQDFARLWEGFCPDELKLYPTQLLENTELYQFWQRGEYQPYTTEELVDLLAEVKATIPPYCRVNRVIRDIPSTHVVAGNRRTSLRQDVLREMERRGTRCRCIRCREVRGESVNPNELEFQDVSYAADGAEEHFLSFVTPEDRLAGFLRLSFPEGDTAAELGIADLEGAALIREVHVYGQSLPLGRTGNGAAQHIGLGTRLLQEAETLARARGYRRLAVIAAVGTRPYYLARGFERGELYLIKHL